MGQCESLFISRNILVPVSLFPFHTPSSIPPLLACAVMAKMITLVPLVEAEIRII